MAITVATNRKPRNLYYRLTRITTIEDTDL